VCVCVCVCVRVCVCLVRMGEERGGIGFGGETGGKEITGEI